ncbi:hypothetical protein ABEB36_005990 [Hypothenemus hampei]|uniref:Apoptosis inhibitor 5 n=1 Tax=Hypothenemus hampei TaxID=57062 RepID=A0ABD1F035_HYPHA
MADLVQELYKKYEVLTDAKDKISEHSAEYLECIEATRGGPQEKKLAAQIIWKFFKHFPSYQDQALNALLDLCEDNDPEIVICAMKVLPSLCKDNKEYVTNIASILTQLLQLEEQGYIVACNSLTQVFREDPINSTKGILSNIQLTGEDGLRDKIVHFLYKKLAKITGKNSAELEDLLINQGKKILQDCTSEEFMIIMNYLLTSKLARTPQGPQELIKLVSQKIEIDEPFEPLEEGTHNTDRLVLGMECIISLFNANNDSAKFVNYYCTQVLPQCQKILTLDDGEQLQLRVFQQLALLSAHCGNIENINEVLLQLFEKLKEFMVLPPENVDINNVPDLEFTTVECLLYAFHKLARKHPEFLTNDAERLKDFRVRLQYFARGVQGCKRSLENNFSKKEDLNDADLNKVKLAPIVLNNINTIIKDLFYQPPLYKCNVQLSFKKDNTIMSISANQANTTSGAIKRHVPITFDSTNGTNTKQVRSTKPGEDRRIYQPPTGKFSNTFGNRTNTRGNWRRGSNKVGGRNWRN